MRSVRPNRVDDALFVDLASVWRAGGEQHPDLIAIGVALQPAHVGRSTRFVDDERERIDVLEEVLRAAGLEERTDAAERDERDRDAPMLRRHVALVDHLAQLRSEQPAGIDTAPRRPRRGRRNVVDAPDPELPMGVGSGRLCPALRKDGSETVADEYLAGPGCTLDREHRVHRRAGQHQFVAMSTRHQAQHGAGLDADRDRHACRARRGRRPAGEPHGALHRGRGPSGANVMVGAVEAAHQPVPGELHDVATLRQHRPDARLEHGVDDVLDDLGAVAADARQSFGESGEAGQIREDERALELPPPWAGRVPAERQVGNIGRSPLRH